MRTALLFTLLCSVAWAGAKGSAFQKETKRGANFWAASQAVDGKLDTAWMVPGESANKGEWIEIDIPRGDVDKIAIFPGYNKSEETWSDYPRVKQMRVDIQALDDDQNATAVGSQTIEIADKREWQIIDITDAKVQAGLFGGKVKLTVTDVYDGEDYPNLAIAEVYVIMKEFDGKAKVTSVDDNPDPAILADALDENPKTFSKLAAGQVIKLESQNFGLSSVGFAPMKDYSRAKTVEVSFGGQTITTVLPEKGTDVGWATIPAFNGYTGGAFGEIEVKIVDSYPGKMPEIGVSELKTRATNFEG